MFNPFWYMGKVVEMGSIFYVMEGIILLVEKGIFGSELIKK